METKPDMESFENMFVNIVVVIVMTLWIPVLSDKYGFWPWKSLFLIADHIEHDFTIWSIIAKFGWECPCKHEAPTWNCEINEFIRPWEKLLEFSIKFAC